MCMKVVLVVRLASDIVRRTGRMKMVLSCSSYLNKREDGKMGVVEGRMCVGSDSRI